MQSDAAVLPDAQRQVSLTELQKGFDVLNEHVVITDKEGVILYANKAVEQTTGYSMQEIIGKRPGELWGGKMPKEFYDAMWQKIKVEKQPFVGEVRNVRKNGSEYWQELHISPIVNGEGDVVYYIAIEPEITERKAREAFREEFLSIARHQILSPLTRNNMLVQLLMSEPGLDQYKKDLEEVYKGDASIIRLLNDLSLLGKIGKQAVTLEEVDLALHLEEILKPIKERHITVIFLTSFVSPATCKTVGALADQVFNNIISNAAEYSHSASPGTVSIKLTQTDSEYNFICLDNGIGIPADEQKNIFTRFYRATNAAREKVSGSGLGLFLAKRICDELGWKISFDSTLGQGTAFYVTIPK